MELSRFLSVVFCLIVFINVCSRKNKDSHTNPSTYINTFLVDPARVTCLHTLDSIHIDGHLEESSWSKTLWSDSFSDIKGEERHRTNPSIQAKFLMDDQNIYIACQVVDSNITSKNLKNNDNLCIDNAIEIFIDPDGDGHNYAELQFTAQGVFTDILMYYPYGTDKGINYSFDWDMTIDYAISVKGTLNDNSDKDQFWNLELAIPISELEILDKNSSLVQNSFYRLNIALVNHEVGEETTYDSWSAMNEVNLHKPESFGYVFVDGRYEPIFTSEEKSKEKLKERMWSDYYALRDCRRLGNRCSMEEVADSLKRRVDKSYLPSIHISEDTFTISSILNDEHTLSLNNKAELTFIKKRME